MATDAIIGWIILEFFAQIVTVCNLLTGVGIWVSGGIGIRATLKMLSAQADVGSIPTWPTKVFLRSQTTLILRSIFILRERKLVSYKISVIIIKHE